MFAILPRGLISCITTTQRLLFWGTEVFSPFVDIPPNLTTFFNKTNRPHLPSYEIMDPFISTSLSSVSVTPRNVQSNISLLILTETFLFRLSVCCTSLMFHFCLKFLAVSAGKGHFESKTYHGKAFRLC